MTLDELCEGMSAKLGIGDIRLGSDGTCSLSVDGLELTLAEKTDTGDLVLMAEVGDLPQEGSGQLLRRLLEKMDDYEQMNGAIYSVEPETKKVFLHQMTKLQLLSVGKLLTMLVAFAEMLRDIRSFVADFRAFLSAPGFGVSGFVQV